MTTTLTVACGAGLGPTINAVIQGHGLAVEIVSFVNGGAFLYICESIEVAKTARELDFYGDAIVAVLISDSENIQEILCADIDRVVENTTRSIQILLQEVGNTWQHSEVRRHRRMSVDSILEHVSESVEITSRDVRIEYVNPAFEKYTGYSKSEAIGKTPADLMRSMNHPPKLFEVMENTCLRGDVWVGEYLARGKNGKESYVLATIVPVLDHAGDILKMVAIKHNLRVEGDDVGAKGGSRRAILHLIKSEERYRKLVDAADDCLVVSDFESGQVLNANQATMKLLGYSLAELRQKTIRMLSPVSETKVLDRIETCIAEEGCASEKRIRLCRSDGSILWATAQYRVYTTQGQTCYLSVLRDVSDEVEKEEQLAEANERLLQSTRLAAVGRLAAGVAHEINNPATFVTHNLEYLEGEVKGLENSRESISVCCDLAEWQDAIGDAMIGMQRIQSVTQQLLGFTRIHQLGKKVVSIADVLDVSLRFVRNEIHHCAKLTLDVQSVPSLWLDENKIGQLFVNLLTNAAHAIEPGQKDRNEICVLIREQGDEVIVRVRDTGDGMGEDIRKRALEPFFSTKEAGKGTGLGLALCYETVTAHNGTLEIESELGVGTTIEIRFSISKNQAPTPVSRNCSSASETEKQRLRVLLIDDQKQILTGYTRILGKRWSLVTAEGGAEALAVLEKDSQFDLIVCDVMMPNVDGPKVLEVILEKYPELARVFVFCTGGAFTEKYQEMFHSSITPMLLKPVSKEAFVEASRAVK